MINTIRTADPASLLICGAALAALIAIVIGVKL